MVFYHGSGIPNLTALVPHLADHGAAYLYLTDNPVVAAFYTVNAAGRPAYWFPYGFDRDGTLHYQEYYPDALRKVYAGERGYLYTVEAEETELLPLKNIPCARLSEKPLPVKHCTVIADCYRWLLDKEKEGAFRLARFADQSPRFLERVYRDIADELTEKSGKGTLIPQYARFIRDNIPQAWKRFVGKA